MEPIETLSIKDTTYPTLLKEIHSPPKTLYWRGNLDALKKRPMIAVVGTRRCSAYGQEATRVLVEGLVRAGIAIVSGMARGIDSIAHEAALASGGTTIAVLGSGIDNPSIYPKQNIGLARRIIKSGGLVMSEYEPGSKGWAGNFPARNRIVAGLSEGTIVVEAPYKSGSMITARYALEEGRDVYAVPGSIFSRLSEATNHLLAQGARCARSASDILENFNIAYQSGHDGGARIQNLPETIREVYDKIQTSADAIHIDALHMQTQLPFDILSQAIATLMLEDFVIETEPNHYVAR